MFAMNLWNISGIGSSLPQKNCDATQHVGLSRASRVFLTNVWTWFGILGFFNSSLTSFPWLMFWTKLVTTEVSAPTYLIAIRQISKWEAWFFPSGWTSVSSPRTISLMNRAVLLQAGGVQILRVQVRLLWSPLRSDMKSQTAKTWLCIKIRILTSPLTSLQILWLNRAFLRFCNSWKPLSLFMLFFLKQFVDR